MKLRFDGRDIHRTGADCAPVALATIAGITLDEAIKFPDLGYTAPMLAALDSLGFRGIAGSGKITYGLIAVKWSATHHWMCVSGDKVLDNYTIQARIKTGINLRSPWVTPEEWERIRQPESKPKITEAIEVERRN